MSYRFVDSFRAGGYTTTAAAAINTTTATTTIITTTTATTTKCNILLLTTLTTTTCGCEDLYGEECAVSTARGSGFDFQQKLERSVFSKTYKQDKGSRILLSV